jgi:hypothetical protein
VWLYLHVVKARPGRDADHLPPSSAELVNEYELYPLSPQTPTWRVEGLLYLLLESNCINKAERTPSTRAIRWHILVVSKALQTLNDKRLLSKEEVSPICFNAVDKQFYYIRCAI